MLMDMSTLYDTIQLSKLQEEALKLNYPPLLLELAMQLYTGPKAVMAEQELTPFFRVDHGVPAGCPQAPLLAKVVLAPALIPWKEKHAQVHLSSWVDDVGFDTAGQTPLQAAQTAVKAYRDLRSKLVDLGLRVNPKKTAFIATDKATDRALRDLLGRVQDLRRWTRPATPLLLEMELSIQDPWWKMEKTLLQEAQNQRTNRLAQRQYHQHLITGLDWHVYHQQIKQMPTEHKTHLKTWVQGAVQFRDNGQPKQCPICCVPATPKHILWLCKWHHGQGHKPMPPAWAERITQHDEDPLWSAGWIALEPEEHRQIEHAYQGHGTWQDLQVLAPHQHQGWAFTLDATPSTYDQRSQVWFFGLCVHAMSLGQLQRLGALTGIPSNPQNKTRALLAGLVALAKHTSTYVKVIVQVVAVCEARTHVRHRQLYMDPFEGLTDQDLQRVTVLYVSRNTRTPGSGPHLKRRQRDAALVAWERANAMHDRRTTEWQQVLDQDHTEIYKHAAARLAKVYAAKDHYIHQKATRAGRRNSAKNNWCSSATNPGRHPITSGNPTVVASIAVPVPVASGSTKRLRSRSLRRGLRKHAPSCAWMRNIQTSAARASHSPRSSHELR